MCVLSIQAYTINIDDDDDDDKKKVNAFKPNRCKRINPVNLEKNMIIHDMYRFVAQHKKVIALIANCSGII